MDEPVCCVYVGALYALDFICRGAGFLIFSDERSYQIIGIYKGREGETNKACATGFDKIKEKYNVDVYIR